MNPDLPVAVEQLAVNCVMVNTFCNPILYTITNRRFGRFVWRMMTNKFAKSGTGSLISTSARFQSSVQLQSSVVRAASGNKSAAVQDDIPLSSIRAFVRLKYFNFKPRFSLSSISFVVNLLNICL